MNTIPRFLLRNPKLGMQRISLCSWRYRNCTIRRYGRQWTVEPYQGVALFVERFPRLWRAREYADWLADTREPV